MKPNTINQATIDALLTRLKDEFTAYYFYRSASNWCNNVGYKKAGEYFAAESADELVHAKKLENFLVDWNVDVKLPFIDSPQSTFLNLVDVIEKAYQLEYNLYLGYDFTSDEIISRKEHNTYGFLQFFRDVQLKSVAEYSDMLNLLDGVDIRDKAKLLLLDEHLFGED
jgi:ferritin